MEERKQQQKLELELEFLPSGATPFKGSTASSSPALWQTEVYEKLVSVSSFISLMASSPPERKLAEGIFITDFRKPAAAAAPDDELGTL